ncbi:hypothetical protein ApDm4_1485 [Acetobacter pomorum]|nr:hypothetical protein ApDm4_1485 [Acetobacter pomorum]
MLADRGEQVKAFDDCSAAVFLGQPVPEAMDSRRAQIDSACCAISS